MRYFRRDYATEIVIKHSQKMHTNQFFVEARNLIASSFVELCRLYSTINHADQFVGLNGQVSLCSNYYKNVIQCI